MVDDLRIEINVKIILAAYGDIIGEDIDNIEMTADRKNYRGAIQRTIHIHTPPIYGQIIGCCGRAPDVHYFREGPAYLYLLNTLNLGVSD